MYIFCIAIAVSTIVTAVLVSMVSVLITSLVFCLLMKRNSSTSTRRKSKQRNYEESKTAVIYDLPNIKEEISDKAMQDNTAYGVLNQ